MSATAATGIGAFAQALARSDGPELCVHPGTVVGGGYAIERELGRGGLGTVYVARDLELCRPVAVKILHGEWASAEAAGELPPMLEREARATASLNHPHIVTVHRYGMWEGRPFLVLELLAGETLAARLLRAPPVAPTEALRVVGQILAGLEHAHGKGVLHRHLSPGNVFVRADGVVKILDFGMSSLRAVASRRPVRVMPGLTILGAGTPGFMAPEQERGELPDARADLWAVGALLATMVGERPGRRLAAFLARARAAAAEDRFADAATMRAALPEPTRWSTRARVLAAMLALAAMLLLAAALLLGGRGARVPTGRQPADLLRTSSPAARTLRPADAPDLEGSWFDQDHPRDADARLDLVRAADRYRVLFGNAPAGTPLTPATTAELGDARVVRVGDAFYLRSTTTYPASLERSNIKEIRLEASGSLLMEVLLTRSHGLAIDGVNTRGYRYTRVISPAR